MSKIIRNIEKATNEKYDLIIVGGGFYGVMLAYEASCRGMKSLLLEKKDFGSATSFNSLRIVHGGLRYLQSLDLHRFKESVGERRWFMKNFPQLTMPMSCLMPLYNRGLQRNSIMWAALNLNDLLSATRNKSVDPKNNLLNGKVVSKDKVKKIFTQVDEKELKGGAIWNDGAMDDSQLVILEILKTAVDNGCTALNYMEVKDIAGQKKKVEGVIATDNETGIDYNFNSEIVINATGPWSRNLAKDIHKEFKDLFKYSIAWNVLFDIDALSDHALAVTPPRENAGAYFLRPWKGKLFAGTVHQPWDKVEDFPIPTEESLQSFIDDLNLSIPDLNLKRENVIQIYSGLLPAKEQGSNEIAVREVIIDHAEHDGPIGLFSLSGVKLTTSRLVSEKVLTKIFKDELPQKSEIPFPSKTDSDYGVFNFNWEIDDELKNILKEKIENESVVHLDDLLLRRTTLGDNPEVALKNSYEVCKLFNWTDEKITMEIEKLKQYYIKRGFTKNIEEGTLV